ncbi:SDR family oxidoreductase [Salinibacterium sp. SYSU T00001]|uniref:SDR family NAD(P)-dependent oxidoreductase n=1 Tax=Homoserinimonas sedimenticola TaxID=2986805 RepID=UPI0022359283|nr:SDR family NAD(P)-dependent oxidoreductase [Salinibacterium sedimenticola]MCW4386238.1 SDR family oxidoreductase [Salinibacterium sedimenticola]
MTTDTTDWLGLKGARVLVIGAGGIGLECIRGYVDAGAQVLVVDRDHAALDHLDGGAGLAAPVRTLQADLLEPGAGRRVVDHAVAQLGGLDVTLHCIGINDRRPIVDFTEDEWQRVIDINLTTAFKVAQAAGRHMTAAGYGRVVMLSSVSGLLAHKLHAPYAASKGGINQMARVMAAEWAQSGVTVNTIAPGYIETGLTSAYLEKPGVRANLESLVPAGRLGVPGDIVGPALFLSSQQSSFVTGHVLYVDGGRTLV